MNLQRGPAQLRELRLSDADSIARHANNRNVWINLRDGFPFPYALADAQAFISSEMRRVVPTNLAIVVEGAAIGVVGVLLLGDVHRRSAEIGYWLGEEFWGRGIATAALQEMTAYAFRTFDINRLNASVFAWNPASMRVLEKAGYHFEARLRCAVTKDGKTTDECVYALIKE